MNSISGNLTIQSFSDADAARWDAYVLAHPDATFFHRAGWRTVIEKSFGHRPLYACAVRGGEICGILPLVHVKSALFGNRLVSTPFCVQGGPLASDDAARDFFFPSPLRPAVSKTPASPTPGGPVGEDDSGAGGRAEDADSETLGAG